MRRYLAVLALSALVLPPLPALAQDATRIDQVVRADVESGSFMGSVLLARDGTVLFDKGYGSANLEWNIPNDGDTKFRLGSITKQFTAAAILLLQERGLLKLTDPIGKYLPDAPAAWDKVTLYGLLTHTAGVPNFTGFDDYESTKTLAANPDSLIARFRGKPLDFEPGTKQNYSNSGYVLLTAVIEKASGKRYADFLSENIFRPLGMADTGYDSHAAILPHRASGYAPGPKGPVNADYLDMTIPQGAGALYSTTHDMLKWANGLFGGKLLRPESLKAMTTPFLNNYALGLIVVTKDGATTIQHGGGIEGFNTWIGYDPDARLTAIVLANINGPAPNNIGRALLTLGRGGNVTLPGERTAIALPPAELAEYVGEYVAAPAFSFVVRQDGAKLTVQATGQDAFELFAEGPDLFFLKVVDAQIAFTRGPDGKVEAAVLKQNGRETRAPRK